MISLTINDIEKYAGYNRTVIQKIRIPGLKFQPEVFIKREDLIHSAISGNKWHKLKYNLCAASENGFDTLLTFGGAYSNHIYSTAAAGQLFGFKTVGIIRGEEHLPLNPTLQFAVNNGMTLEYLDRTTFKRKNDPEFLEKLKSRFSKIYILPEGGTNELAVKGCSEIMNNIDQKFDYICLPVGTGGTISGVIAGENNKSFVLGFSVLKGGGFLKKIVAELTERYCGKFYKNWDIDLDYHFGGYAKISSELIFFINEFEKLNSIKLDPIYTGKMLYGIFDLFRKGKFEKSDNILAIHTGGLQGIDGMKGKMEKLLADD